MGDLSQPAAEVRRYDRDRFLCALFAPADRREALLALYAFNVAVARVRETVSEPLIGEIRLQWWQDTIAAAYAATRSADPVAGALADAIARFGLRRSLFEELIDGRRRDLDDRPPADLAELVVYAEATAGALNELALAILGAEGEEVDTAARNIGIAWALTGLMRALPLSVSQGRIWLPDDLMKQAGVDPVALCAGKPGPVVATAVAAVADAARHHLTVARTALPRAPKASWPVLTMGRLVAADLRRLARSGHDPFAARRPSSGVGRLLRLGLGNLGGRY
jgi:NADH dehydrogenase [ubiquinone] 1 alpha subcomplex assembly factor 6